jgi:hypothetical protein
LLLSWLLFVVVTAFGSYRGVAEAIARAIEDGASDMALSGRRCCIQYQN